MSKFHDAYDLYMEHAGTIKDAIKMLVALKFQLIFVNNTGQNFSVMTYRGF